MCRIAEALAALGVNCPSDCSGVKEFCPEVGLSVAEARKLDEDRRAEQGGQQSRKFQGDLEAHKEIFLNTSKVG